MARDGAAAPEIRDKKISEKSEKQLCYVRKIYDYVDRIRRYMLVSSNSDKSISRFSDIYNHAGYCFKECDF